MNRAPLTALAALALGLLIGFVLGGVSPRRELVASQQEVVMLEEALEEAPSRGLRSPLPGFERILRPPPRDPRDAQATQDTRDGREDERGPVAARRSSLGDAGVIAAGSDRDEGDETPYAAFQRAASVQRVRMLQSRAALVEQGDLDDAEVASLDAALQTMNDALVGYGEELILFAEGGERPPPRELLGITHDVTGILQSAQLELEAILGAERAGEVDASALEIWNHVDLELLEPAAHSAMERAGGDPGGR
ncbi:MAG: hypothetical protein AB8H86_18725 [Polyangiales bacterium]